MKDIQMVSKPSMTRAKTNAISQDDKETFMALAEAQEKTKSLKKTIYETDKSIY